MIRRYEARIEAPHAPETILLGTYRTPESAARRVERALARHVTVETRYSRERHPWSGSVTDRKGVHRSQWVEAPVVLVASVGELGWTP